MFVGITNLKKKLMLFVIKCHDAPVISGINFLSAWSQDIMHYIN